MAFFIGNIISVGLSSLGLDCDAECDIALI